MKKTFVLTTVTALAPGILATCGGSKKVDGSVAEAKAASSGKTTLRIVDEIKESGMIHIGVFADKASFGHVDASDVNQGYDVVYTQRIAQDFGVKVGFTSLGPAARAEYVNAGKVDITLANFTITKEGAEQVDSVRPYMKVALGVVSPGKAVIYPVNELRGKTLIITKDTTVETYSERNYPEVKLQKYDAYADAYSALLDGRGGAFSTDNTEVIARTKMNPGFKVGIDSLGDYDTTAAAVAEGNETLPNFLNEKIVALDKEDLSHKNYSETLKPVLGDTVNPGTIIMKGGELGGIKQ